MDDKNVPAEQSLIDEFPRVFTVLGIISIVLFVWLITLAIMGGPPYW